MAVVPRGVHNVRFRFTGFAGWVVWLFVHPYYLIGFETRVQVMLRRSWYYVRYDRPVRSVIRAHPPRTPNPECRLEKRRCITTEYLPAIRSPALSWPPSN